MSEQLNTNKVSLQKVFKDLLRHFYIPDMGKMIAELEDPLNGNDLEQMLDITKRLREKIIAHRDAIKQKTNWKEKNLEKYMENQDNFSKGEWKALDKFKKDLDEYKKEFQIAAQGAGIRQIVKEGRERAARKKNKLERIDEQKKKNWIPM